VPGQIPVLPCCCIPKVKRSGIPLCIVTLGKVFASLSGWEKTSGRERYEGGGGGG
jgi:hypothetical protein